MQSGLRWGRAHSRQRSPVARRALRAAVRAPLWSSWHLGIGQALRAVWSVSGLRPIIGVCAPARPVASPLRGISHARWAARPPPKGAPSARAGVFALAWGFGAPARGLTGLQAWRPGSQRGAGLHRSPWAFTEQQV